MADDTQKLKAISDNIEAMYQALRRAASNIAGLLQLGRATCDEVKAYNLWALATYNTQRGMLETLRAGGEQGLPTLPSAPTLFTWRGVTGANAWQINCSNEPDSGLMGKVLKGPGPAPVLLSTKEIQISTQDQYAFNPESSPTFKTLLQVQEARAKQGVAGLGVIGILIVIAGIAIAVSVAIAAIMHYLEVSSIQESNTKQVRAQSEAFANYTSARLSCFASCTQGGKSSEECAPICAKLVDKPNIKLPGQGTSWSTLQWVGFLTLAGIGSMAAWKLWQRRREGRPLFELPEALSGVEIHKGHNRNVATTFKDLIRDDDPNGMDLAEDLLLEEGRTLLEATGGARARNFTIDMKPLYGPRDEWKMVQVNVDRAGMGFPGRMWIKYTIANGSTRVTREEEMTIAPEDARRHAVATGWALAKAIKPLPLDANEKKIDRIMQNVVDNGSDNIKIEELF